MISNEIEKDLNSQISTCPNSSINLTRQISNSLKIQAKDFIIRNPKHLAEVYTIDNQNTLGEGGHASVYKVMETSEGKLLSTEKCIKKFQKKNLFYKNNEIQSLKALDHPNIVKIFEYFDERDAYYIVMEQVKGRDLFDEIAQRGKPFNEKEACQIVKQILLALKYTHQKGLMHRDIKLENIMVYQTSRKVSSDQINSKFTKQQNQNSQNDQNSNKSDENSIKQNSQTDETSIQNEMSQTTVQNCQNNCEITQNNQTINESSNSFEENINEERQWNVKLIDWSFGLDTNIKKNKFYNTMCGSLQYQPPEYFEKKYNEKIDIWALGVVMYTILCNKYPFTGKNKLDTQTSIQKGNITFGNEWDHISDEAKDIIKKMLEKDPEKRPSAEELLGHIWFKLQKSNDQYIQDTELIKKNLRNLKQFKCDNEFQKAILTFISINLVSSNEKMQLEKLFKMLDTNDDGKLSKDEILNGFNQVWGENYMDIQQIQQIFEQVDSDQSDSIDYSEFITATLQRNIFNSKNYLQKAFELFDTDGDGQITKDEILRVLANSYDQGITEEIENYIQQIIDQVDLNQDGKIQMEEFFQMIQSFSNTEIVMSQ